MGIRFHCSECRERLHVKDFLGGKRGVCPKCHSSIWIPERSGLAVAGEADAEPESDGRTDQEYSAEGVNKASSHGAQPQRATPNGALRGAGPGSSTAIADEGPSVANETSRTSRRARGGEEKSVPVPDRGETARRSRDPAPESVPRHPQSVSAPMPQTPAADPFVQGAAVVWHVRPASGGQYGPADGATMKKWVGEGRVPVDALVWRSDWSQWRRAGDELTGYLPAVVPAPGPAHVVPAHVVPAPVARAVEAAGKLARINDLKRRRRAQWIAVVAVLSCVAVVLIVALIAVLRRS